jgi:hypothetical protein
VICWNDLIEAERIEQLSLLPVEPPHHCQPPLPPLLPAANHASRATATDFCNKICQELPLATPLTRSSIS